MDVIEIVKAKVLPEKLPNDILLAMYLEEVRQSILTFCNRTDIPTELNFVYANMVVDLINGENRKAEQDAQREVTSIKEGDVQVNFGGAKQSSSESATQQILYNYKSQLLRYRKLRW
ncbi:hypothetical protein [Cytobacillus praedii]|uniref:DNA-packaging protein n=1 Tax=Cytobacillus praedii TaxID=1742358 RepID=A0A4R1ANQ6_9BACI|nr:hypothetical protein [Cytobacillus praedii]TCJ01498.1 hypothetical protein E0Y62_23775 [Cytobacillus praedii]